jgi:3-dehydroquinate dehydratase
MADKPENPPAEPSGEALIGTLHEIRVCFASWQKDVRVLGNVRSEDACRALDWALTHLASNAEALAKAQEMTDALQQAGELVTRRAETAEAALAECRAKTIEECARVSDCYIVDGIETVNSVKREIASAIRALAKEAPRHDD